MEKNNNCVKVGFSTILWAVLAILLCATPCGWAVDISVPITGPYYAEGEVNVYADITYGLFAAPGSMVNIYAGAIGDGQSFGITVSPDTPYATVTVYGTDFAVDGTPLVPSATEFTPANGGSVLTVTYENETLPTNLLFYSDIPIYLVNTAGAEPLEAELWVFPSLINRYGPLSKILAMVRLPEGITKDDIDSDQMLVLYADGYDVEIEASCQQIIEWCRNGTVHTTIIASFDKAELIEAVPDGDVEIEVVGGLNSGQDFYGTDTVRIVSWYWNWW